MPWLRIVIVVIVIKIAFYIETYCEPPKGTLSEAKSARRGELIGRVKICIAIKLRFEKKKFVRFLAKTASPVLAKSGAPLVYYIKRKVCLFERFFRANY